ncbi:putative reverse transcriptase zinc-binding domain-containing protein [Arabidopsis thaliana]
MVVHVTFFPSWILMGFLGEKHLVRGRNFWDADFRFTGSWIWRRLAKLRSIARTFIFCSVVSGPLIDVVGVAGPRVTGIGVLAVVADAANVGSWLLPRGRHPLVILLRSYLTSHDPPTTAIGDDIFLWKTSPDQSHGNFSSARTWNHLHPAGPTVPWYSQIWFKERILKLAFMAWLTVKDRLTTSDRLISWNILVPASCLLCLNGDESRDHLFFHCNFSKALLLDIYSQFIPLPSTSFSHLLIWIKNPTTNRKLNSICKLVFHALVYNIWRKRNSRLHSTSRKSETQVKREIHLLLRRKLASLDIAASPSLSAASSHETYLSLWFGNFQQN